MNRRWEKRYTYDLYWEATSDPNENYSFPCDENGVIVIAEKKLPFSKKEELFALRQATKNKSKNFKGPMIRRHLVEVAMLEEGNE